MPHKSFTNKAFNHASASNITPQVTLMVAFYNNVDFFKKVFASIEAQTFKNFELIICDDGSKDEATQALVQLVENSHIPVQHLWHEDRGFFKNEALNRGILYSRADYLIFIDADCVLHPFFVEDHWESRTQGHTLAGRRVNLTPWASSQLTVERIRQGYLQKNWWWLFLTLVWMKDNNSIKGFRIKSQGLFRLFSRKPRGIVGCNFSVFKKDLFAVNGFDMTYDKPGIGEDSDIDFRLSGVGVTPVPLVFRGIQYHLYHRLLPRSDKNEAKFVALKESKKYVTDQGLKQLSERQGF